jgi:DNA invertase Pin-like site-specific DNA recombinase
LAYLSGIQPRPAGRGSDRLLRVNASSPSAKGLSIRVSGKGQLDGDGFTRQRETIERYAAANNITITQWFEEQGVSGTKDLENRPALSELISALHSNGTRLVLIEKLDRLARDLMVQETIIGDIRECGLELVSVCEPDLCSDDPSRKLVRQMFGAIAEYEKSMIVLKLRGARQRRRSTTGRGEGRKPFGTRVGESLAVARVRDVHVLGKSQTEIAQAMNEENQPTRTGGKWYAATVSRVLRRAKARA